MHQLIFATIAGNFMTYQPLSPFRKKHALILLDLLDASKLPLDTAMSKYFRAHKSLGSKDRFAISQRIYALKRWQGAIDTQLKGPISWEDRLAAIENIELETVTKNESLPPHQRASFPKKLYSLIENSLGKSLAFQVALDSNMRAPLFIRANLLKTSRESLIEKLSEEGVRVRPSERVSSAIEILQKVQFFSLNAFKEGLFEVQDENSQKVADCVLASPGDIVLDYCAGSGGKALAIAPRLKGKGQLYLHDIRIRALDEAKKRLSRAGIQNAQRLAPDHPQLKKLVGQVDWTLVDAPCSGTGTLRRNPDLKWKFDPDRFEKLLCEQREIFKSALKFVRPRGHIVYATCSILKEENADQTAYFLKQYSDLFGLKLISEMQTYPKPHEGDGLYAAVFSVDQNPSPVQ